VRRNDERRLIPKENAMQEQGCKVHPLGPQMNEGIMKKLHNK
jgi:hypothetical protein